MGDEIRFVKNIPDAIEKIRVLRAAGFDMFPEVDQIIWEVRTTPNTRHGGLKGSCSRTSRF